MLVVGATRGPPALELALGSMTAGHGIAAQSTVRLNSTSGIPMGRAARRWQAPRFSSNDSAPFSDGPLRRSESFVSKALRAARQGKAHDGDQVGRRGHELRSGG